MRDPAHLPSRPLAPRMCSRSINGKEFGLASTPPDISPLMFWRETNGKQKRPTCNPDHMLVWSTDGVSGRHFFGSEDRFHRLFALWLCYAARSCRPVFQSPLSVNCRPSPHHRHTNCRQVQQNQTTQRWLLVNLKIRMRAFKNITYHRLIVFF